VEKFMTTMDKNELTEEDKAFLTSKSEAIVQRLIERKSAVNNQNKEHVKRLVKECDDNAATSIENQLKERDEVENSSKKSRKEFQGPILRV
jgi:hypothetical protein